MSVGDNWFRLPCYRTSRGGLSMRLPFMRHDVLEIWIREHRFSAGDDCNYFLERDDYQIKVSWRGQFRCVFSRSCNHDITSVVKCKRFPCSHESNVMRVLAGILRTLERVTVGRGEFCRLNKVVMQYVNSLLFLFASCRPKRLIRARRTHRRRIAPNGLDYSCPWYY